jgi:hypothetical protein
MHAAGGVEMMHGSRISFSIAQFDGLVSDTEFINDFATLCGISKSQGLWPDQSWDILRSQPEVTETELSSTPPVQAPRRRTYPPTQRPTWHTRALRRNSSKISLRTK